jgi:hypothetical protein
MWKPGPLVLPNELSRTLFITVHADQVAAAALGAVDTVLAVGEAPRATIAQFAAVLGETPSLPAAVELGTGEVLLWSRVGQESGRVRLVPSVSERRRHTRKYAEGELPPERSFWFRGPHAALNLRAQNLILFMQLADGVDDETWTFHLHRGDYSRWFREHIKDEALANHAAAIEERRDLSAADSRALLRGVIEQLYTLPAGPPLPMPADRPLVAKP